MKGRVFLPLILVAVTLAWVGSAGAFSISFIEPSSPTANIMVTTDISGSTIITTGPESASLSGSVPSLGTLAVSTIIDLHEGSLTGPVSDRLNVLLSPSGMLQVFFGSDSEVPFTGVGNQHLVETGLPQLAFASTFGGGLPDPETSLFITVQSDLDPVPEPSTLLLFGSSLAGLGGFAWRRRRS